MPNLSQLKRERMLAFLQKIKDEHRDDDDMLIALGEIESELTSKKYGLVWEQHEEAVDVMMRDNVPVFTEVPEREITAAPGQGYNFILEGDNLHSLRLLEKTHKGKIDIIYIDPPYNRGGNDFRYEDTFVEKQDGFRHSKWLSFMESRLRIAWQLLKSDGVIFISIDDFEMGALRMLCDDVFGEAFFLCNIVWQKRYSRENREAIGDAHEYILVYAKDKLKFKENRHLVPMSEEQAKVYKNPNNDPKGRWRAVPMTAQGYRPNQMYPIVDPKGGVHYPPEGRCWSTIFTSNLLSEAEYKKVIPPELQTRFDLVCEFEEPTTAEKTAFLDLLLEMAKTKYSEQFAKIEITEDDKKRLYAFDYSSLSALRDIKRVFNNRLMDYFVEKGVL